MRDSISRQAVLDMLEDINNHIIDGCGYNHKWCVEWVKGLPSIDAVPVVRCAECKWFQCNMSMEGYLPKGVDEFECRHWCGPCDPIDFCSYGERKES